MPSVYVGWNFLPPPGLTDIRQLPHRFQQATADNLAIEAERIAMEAVDAVESEWFSVYPYGQGTIPSSLKYDIKATRSGVSVRFGASGRHLGLITTLGGGSFRAGRGFKIRPKRAKRLVFFWDKVGQKVSLRFVQHPGWNRDLLAEIFSLYGSDFQAAMGAAYDAGISSVLAQLGDPMQNVRKRR